MKTKTEQQHTPKLESTEQKLTKELSANLPELIAYEGIIYEKAIGGEVFADCRTGDQVLSKDIIKSRFIVRAVNSHETLLDALKLSRQFVIAYQVGLRDGLEKVQTERDVAFIDTAIAQAEQRP